MSVPVISGVEFSEPSAGPLLLLGPSLGTAVTPLWETCARELADTFHVVGWDLPGHGTSPAPDEAFTMAELARGVLAVAEQALAARGEANGTFAYAGVSVGGAVGLQLLLDAPARVSSAALICTGAKIGSPEMWTERAAMVRAFGTPTMVEGSAKRWFAPGFLEREPDLGGALLTSLQEADPLGYAFTCKALAGYDVRSRLGSVTTPVLTIAGADDEATPPSDLQLIADGVTSSRSVVLDDVAHLASVEAPAAVAELLVEALVSGPIVTEAQRRSAGMDVRRQVLGDAHVDRATAGATGFTSEFQEFITQYAWGGIWTRPGLDRRTRSFITLTALVARGHHEELAMHVRAALGNGVTVDELKELFLQTTIYCGVPDANTAFRIAQKTLLEEGIEL